MKKHSLQSSPVEKIPDHIKIRAVNAVFADINDVSLLIQRILQEHRLVDSEEQVPVFELNDERALATYRVYCQSPVLVDSIAWRIRNMILAEIDFLLAQEYIQKIDGHIEKINKRLSTLDNYENHLNQHKFTLEQAHRKIQEEKLRANEKIQNSFSNRLANIFIFELSKIL